MSNGCPDITDLDIAEALSLAILSEERGFEFYKKIAETTEEASVKNEIEFLMNEEKKHKAVFTKLLKDNGLSVVENEESDLNCWVEDEIINPMKEAVENIDPHSTIEALKVGLRLENKSIELFTGLKEASNDEETRNAIDRILQEELTHRKKLNIMISY